jgi:ubiquinone/menaquinone biosynthesis C-methylase UbiE
VTDAYFNSRFTEDPRRDAIWVHIVRHLARWIPDDAAVLDVGAGYCSFINNVKAARRVAVDLYADLEKYAAPGVETVRTSAINLQAFRDGEFDVVFASNLLEHLSRADIDAALGEFHRVLKAGGRLLLVQPNYRLRPGEYFDDYTHLTPLSDRSLPDLLKASGYEVLEVQGRFLPLTMKSRAGALGFLVPLYLRSPVRPFAGQMLVVAGRGRNS